MTNSIGTELKKPIHTLSSLASMVSGSVVGNGDLNILGLSSLSSARPGQLSFLHNYKKSSQEFYNSKASAFLIRQDDLKNSGLTEGNFILVQNPYIAYAILSKLFDDTPSMEPLIDSSAIIGEGTTIGDGVAIGPYVVIGRRVKIGNQVRIEAGVIVGDDSIIGDGTRLCSRVTICHGVVIGKRVLIHSGAVIGSDGFGNANNSGKWVKIYQLGKVIVGDEVEIGANTTVDRGALDDTIIGEGVKIDNQVQIGHNVRIGSHTAIAACVGIAGSTEIGSYCMLGGGVGVAGHLKITNATVITAMSGVSRSIDKSGVYSATLPAVEHISWWRVLSRLMNLERLVDRVKKLEQK